MPKTIRFTGSERGWDELSVTGKPSVWQPGQQEERSDSEAALLIATGLFSQVFTGSLTELGAEVSELGGLRAVRSDLSRKLIHRFGTDDLRVLTTTDTGKVLQYTFRRGVFDPSDSSVGVESSWWRLLRLTEMSGAYLFRTGAPDASTGAWTTGQTSMYPGTDASERYQVQSRRSIVQGSTKTYNITVPASGRVGVVFAVTASSPTAVTLTCGAVSQVFDMREANDGPTGTAKVKLLELTGCTPGAGSVVITLTTRESGQTLYVFGPLIADLSRGLPATIPASTALVCTFNLTDQIVGVTSNGSSDIAIKDLSVNRWAGSWHGGHRSSAEFLDGATAIDVSTTGAFVVAAQPRIVQDSDVAAGKLAFTSEHSWAAPGELVLRGRMRGSISADRAYIMMCTTRADWTIVNGELTEATEFSTVIGRGTEVVQSRPGDPSRYGYIRAYSARVNGQAVEPYLEKWRQSDTYTKTRLGVLGGVTTVADIDFVTSLGIEYA
jgi:hypothetical protein